MRHIRRLSLRGAFTPIVVLAGAVALTVGLALAGEKQATIEATKFTVDSGQTGEAFAKCGSGKRALGGGVVQSGSADLLVDASGPLDASGVTLQTVDGDVAKQWYAAVESASGVDDRPFKVFAICAGGSNATIEATKFTVDSGQTGEAFAKCGSGRRALGGGVVQSGSPDLLVQASGPLDASGVTLNTRDGDVAKQWYAAVHNSSGVDDRVFQVYAICAGGSNATIEATKFTVASGRIGEEFVNCLGSKRALGGGVVQSGSPAGLFVRASGPLDASGVILNTRDGDVAKQWYAAVQNSSGVDDRVFKVFAICV
jgi:hypothetical protein